MFKRLIEFLKDTRVELTKISWPNRHELRESTVVVIITVVLITLFIGAVDQIFNFLWRSLLGT
jgi:preprotein translocase subunit SecE